MLKIRFISVNSFILFGCKIPVILATPYSSTTPFTSRFVVLDFVFLNSETFPFSLVTVVLNGSGKFLSSKLKIPFVIFTGPTLIFVLEGVSFLFVIIFSSFWTTFSSSFVGFSFSFTKSFLAKTTEIFGLFKFAFSILNPAFEFEIFLISKSKFLANIFVLSLVFKNSRLGSRSLIEFINKASFLFVKLLTLSWISFPCNSILFVLSLIFIDDFNSFISFIEILSLSSKNELTARFIFEVCKFIFDFSSLKSKLVVFKTKEFISKIFSLNDNLSRFIFAFLAIRDNLLLLLI